MRDGNALAVRALTACRNQLFFENRFLEPALFRLVLEDGGAVCFGSEGSHLFYQPEYVLKRYMKEPRELMFDYLHTVLHCLYQHPFFVPQKQEMYWDLAADIAAECILEELLPEGGELSAARGKWCHDMIGQLKNKIHGMSAQRIFAFLCGDLQKEEDFFNFFGAGFGEVSAAFRRDDHSIWYHTGTKQEKNKSAKADQEKAGKNKSTETRQEKEGKNKSTETKQEKAEQNKSTETRQEKTEQNKSEDGKSEAGSHPNHGTDGFGLDGESNGTDRTNPKQLQQIWKNVAERILVETQSFAKQRGDAAGDMMKTLTLLTRENYDYSAFLLKFATHLEERMQIDLDEFDYIFYTYGLQLDKRMPLIEPLEYKEKYLLREFVIAIDTSGSCAGELVEKFLVKTYNILRQTESFAVRVRIHIIQCDARIQEDVTIRSQKDLEDYISHLTLKGFGGTDFCPVFEYVEEMLRSGELQRLEGLLYFTDGYGNFPKKPPKYKTAFVFLGQDEDVRVPAWAMKVYLEKEGLA